MFEKGGETTLAECFARGERMLSGIGLTHKRVVTNVAMVHEAGHPHKRVVTNVAMVHEAGHPEPWFIALSEAPTPHRAFDCGLRWGIEAMFADFKSRGFGLAESQLRRTDRLDRLLLVMALALHWAVSTGMWDATHRATPDEKTFPNASPAISAAA